METLSTTCQLVDQGAMDSNRRRREAGFAWTQNGEDVVTATLQGAYVKQGKVFKMYTFDPTSSGKLNFATGIVDFVAKTMKFKVSEVDTSL